MRVAGATIALTILFSIVDPEKLSHALAQSDVGFLLPAFLIAIASPLLTSARLKLFLSATGTQVAYSRCFFASLCGLSLNLFLPARGGDLVKLAYLRQDGKPSWGILAGAALLERGFDVLSLGLLGLTVSLALGLRDTAIISGSVTMAAILGLLILPRLGSLPIVGKKAKNFSSIVKMTSQNKLRLLSCFGVCCICWTTNSIVMGLLLKAFEDTISLTHAFAVTPPSILVGIVPVSLWGVGTRDGALAYFLQGFTSPENAISAGFLYTAFVYWLLGLIGLPALLFARRKTKAITDDSAKSNDLGSS